jgi:hypothetical protein
VRIGSHCCCCSGDDGTSATLASAERPWRLTHDGGTATALPAVALDVEELVR